MSRAAPLLALLLLGCAENAIFELTFRVPPQSAAPAGSTVAMLEFRSDRSTTPPTTPGTDVRTANLPLGDAVTNQTVSVVASGEDIETPLWIGVTYCAAASGCLAVGSPRDAWLRYERAFWVGEYTEHEIDLPTTGEERVERCAVWGCLMGERPASGACIDGVHACE